MFEISFSKKYWHIFFKENNTLELKFFPLRFYFFQQLDSLQLTGPSKTKDEADKDRWDSIKYQEILVFSS